MTNNEAKRKVRGYLTDILPSDCSDEIDEIMKALEQQPSEDCISREHAKQFLYYEIERLHDDSLYDCFARIIDDMYNELPSVIPQIQPNSNEFFNFDAPMVKNSEAVSRGVLTEYINTMLTSNEEMASNATNEGRWVEEKT